MKLTIFVVNSKSRKSIYEPITAQEIFQLLQRQFSFSQTETSTPGQLKMGILPFFYYHGDCNDPNTQVTLKQNFLNLSSFLHICFDPASCTAEAVQIFCGNVTSPVRRRRRSTTMEVCYDDFLTPIYSEL